MSSLLNWVLFIYIQDMKTLTGAGGFWRVAIGAVVARLTRTHAGCHGGGMAVRRTGPAVVLALLRLEGPWGTGCKGSERKNV